MDGQVVISGLDPGASNMYMSFKTTETCDLKVETLVGNVGLGDRSVILAI